MKKKIILQIVITLFMSALLISCESDNQAVTSLTKQTVQAVPSLTKQTVVLASGVSFKSNKFVVINSIDGKEVQPCANTIIIQNNDPTAQGSPQSNQSGKGKQNDQPCDNKIVEPSEVLLNVLNVKDPIEGTILKNGEKIKARFFVSVEALYKGSICNTKYLSGAAYTQCVTQQQIDDAE
jgi:hypothetical protein